MRHFQTQLTTQSVLGGLCAVHELNPQAALRPEELPEDLAALGQVQSRELRDLQPIGFALSGRLPLWFFSAATAAWASWAGLFGEPPQPPFEHVRWIGVVHPAFGIVVVSSRRESLPMGSVITAGGSVRRPVPQAARPAIVVETHQGKAVVRPMTYSGGLHPQDLCCLPEDLAAVPQGADLVRLDGPFPAWLAASCTLWLAMQRPGVTVTVRALQEGGDVVVYTDHSSGHPLGSVLRLGLSGLARVVGLIGDPNSGKSVLSWKLYRCLRSRLQGRCYRLDCDAYAPTPEWSLLGGLGPIIRNDIKKRARERAREDERRLVRVLDRLRHSGLELVLADLPGGIWRGNRVERIPQDSVPLFRCVDAFVLLARSPATVEGWKRALEPHGLLERLRYIVWSHRWPTGDSELWERVDRILAIRIGALDRALLDLETPGVVRLAEAIISE